MIGQPQQVNITPSDRGSGWDVVVDDPFMGGDVIKTHSKRAKAVKFAKAKFGRGTELYIHDSNGQIADKQIIGGKQ